MHTDILPQTVAMIVLDANGLFLGMNSAAEHLLEDHIIDFITDWLPAQNNTIIDFSDRRIRVDSLRTAQATYFMLFDETPARAGQTTQQRRPESKHARQDDRQELNLMTAKSSSTTVIARQFGTPISAIRLKSYLLKQYLDSLSKERIGEHLDQIEAQLDQMVDLLDDLLLVNQVYSPEQVALLSPLDLEAFCAKILDSLHLEWPDREIVLYSSGRLDNVQLDRRLIRYILANLVSVILNYSSSGVRLDIRRVENFVALSVSAPNIVLPAHQFDQLLAQFSIGSAASALSSVSFSLSVMKLCIEMYGGTLIVSSKPAQGTRFLINLPCRDAL